MKYVINIDYPPENQARLKGLTAMLGVTARQFISEAIDNEIDYRLKKMSKEEREVAETIMKNHVKVK